MSRAGTLGIALIAGAACTSSPAVEHRVPPDEPFVVVLGVAQDGGVPQTGDWDHPGWQDSAQTERVSSLGFVDPSSGTALLFDATPDLPEQTAHLHRVGARALPHIFLTHAHMGHYTGLMHVGNEETGASDVPVYAAPRMAAFLRSDGPWSQLVAYGNIALQEQIPDSTEVTIGPFSVTSFRLPHREEYSEVVGYRIQGPQEAVLFIPDIDSWEDWDAWGVRIEDLIAGVDHAYLDATFFDDGELPGRDMSAIPHPRIRGSMDRFAALPETERRKVRFIHLNHTNPALRPGPERDEVFSRGFAVAERGEMFGLGANPSGS